MTERRFTLRWKRTWEDTSHDFAAYDGDLHVGRVYRLMGGPSDSRWRWAMYVILGNRIGNSTGMVEDRDTACKLVETAYWSLRETIDREKR